MKYLKMYESKFVPGVWGSYDNRYSINALVNLIKDKEPIILDINTIIDKNKDLETKEGNFFDNINNPTSVFKHRAEISNTSFPIMVDEEGWIIDGSHRIAKLYWEGEKNIKAYIITQKDLLKAKIK